jgi:guanylate kinase
MPKYSVVFIAPVEKNQLKHRIIESADQESALRTFFAEESSEYYSNDEQGFFYFKQDFFDQADPSGSIIPLN